MKWRSRAKGAQILRISGELVLSPLADGCPLVFGDSGQDADGEPVGVRIVGCEELDVAVHQRGDEGQIAAQAVELGDDELGLVLATGG